VRDASGCAVHLGSPVRGGIELQRTGITTRSCRRVFHKGNGACVDPSGAITRFGNSGLSTVAAALNTLGQVARNAGQVPAASSHTGVFRRCQPSDSFPFVAIKRRGPDRRLYAVAFSLGGDCAQLVRSGDLHSRRPRFAQLIAVAGENPPARLSAHTPSSRNRAGPCMLTVAGRPARAPPASVPARLRRRAPRLAILALRRMAQLFGAIAVVGRERQSGIHGFFFFFFFFFFFLRHAGLVGFE